jgi:iron complex transport system substrate-binding protein
MQLNNHVIPRRTFIGGALASVGCIAACGLFGCSGPAQASTESQAAPRAASQEEWTLIDQADNEVTVQVPVSRMVVMQHHSLDMLAQLGAQDKVVGIESKWENDLGTYMRDVFPDIDNLPTPGDLTDWNVEQIAALQPDVVIAASQANPDAMQQIRDLGIPVIVVSLRGEGKQEEAQSPHLADADRAYEEGCQWAIETLGKLVEKEEKAAEIWDFCLNSRSLVEDAVGNIDESERARVFVIMPNDMTYGNDKFVGCMLLRAGAINVAAKDIQGNGAYTFEMLANWDPDIILVQDRYKDEYDAFTTDPRYAELAAVKNEKVILAPYWTKPWGNPDTDSIALGELWLAHTFYPDMVEESIVKQRAQEFYENFYGVEFTGTI